jgi:hypothetical protein
LPEHKVERVALSRIIGLPPMNSREFEHCVTGFVTDLAESWELRYLKVHVAIDFVGVSLLKGATN